MFRDLLVHVDGSEAGRRRLQFAVDLAQRPAEWIACGTTAGRSPLVQAKPTGRGGRQYVLETGLQCAGRKRGL
jgi:nucleotide-binding universal stress UspA family protein